MADENTGAEQFTDEDRRYAGSRFREVVDALFANPYQTVWGREGEPPLPDQEQTIRSVFGGLLAQAGLPVSRARPNGRSTLAPTCGGADRKGSRDSSIQPASASSAAGRSPKTRRIPDTSARAVRRSWSPGTERGGRKSARPIRSLALVGKLFPTMDPDHPIPLRTANFITQEDIGGERTDSINAAELRNAPDVTVFRRGPAGTLRIKVTSVFRRVDTEPTIRQLYPIAELGKPADEPTTGTAFMRLLVGPSNP